MAQSPPQAAYGFRGPRIMREEEQNNLEDCSEDQYSDWSDDEEESQGSSPANSPKSLSLAVPKPRDPAHYRAMVYSRAILNAKAMAQP